MRLSLGFFGRAEDEDAEQAESLARIEEGGIPRRGEERLRVLAADGSLFTSGLSVNEFALLDRLGPQPLAQVMGASVVRTGWQYLPALDPGKVFFGGSPYGPTPTGRALQNLYTEPSLSQVRNYRWHTELVCELDTLTDGWNMARRRALDRLWEEASQVGADAVVGVHLHRSAHDLVKGTIEYVVSGTAIRLPDSAAAKLPILTDVSGQDYWRLQSAGHQPVGFVASTSVVFASPSKSALVRRMRTTSRNQELEELSRGFHVARDAVRARLLGQVADARGTAAVGVELSHSVHREKLALASSVVSTSVRGWHLGRLGLPYRVSGRSDVERRGWVITMHAAGTAIRTRRDSAQPAVKTSLRMGAR